LGGLDTQKKGTWFSDEKDLAAPANSKEFKTIL
jgi:hypothetical protein